MKKPIKKYKAPHKIEMLDYEFLAGLEFWPIKVKYKPGSDNTNSFLQAWHSLWMLLFAPTYYDGWEVYTEKDWKKLKEQYFRKSELSKKWAEPTEEFRAELDREEINFSRFIEHGFKTGKLVDCGSKEDGRVALAVDLLDYIGESYPVSKVLVDALKNKDLASGAELLRKFRTDFHDHIKTGVPFIKTILSKNKGGRPKLDHTGKAEKLIHKLIGKGLSIDAIINDSRIINIIMEHRGNLLATNLQYYEIRKLSKDEYHSKFKFARSTLLKLARECLQGKTDNQ